MPRAPTLAFNREVANIYACMRSDAHTKCFHRAVALREEWPPECRRRRRRRRLHHRHERAIERSVHAHTHTMPVNWLETHKTLWFLGAFAGARVRVPVYTQILC